MSRVHGLGCVDSVRPVGAPLFKWGRAHLSPGFYKILKGFFQGVEHLEMLGPQEWTTRLALNLYRLYRDLAWFQVFLQAFCRFQCLTKFGTWQLSELSGFKN